MWSPVNSDYRSGPWKLEPSTAGAIESVLGAREIDHYPKLGVLVRWLLRRQLPSRSLSTYLRGFLEPRLALLAVHRSPLPFGNCTVVVRIDEGDSKAFFCTFPFGLGCVRLSVYGILLLIDRWIAHKDKTSPILTSFCFSDLYIVHEMSNLFGIGSCFIVQPSK